MLTTSSSTPTPRPGLVPTFRDPSLSLFYVQGGMTPLHGAETAEVAKALMDAKANIHAQTKVSAYAVGEGVCVCI